MKKTNNKGYVLVETLVVSAFVMVMFVLLYKNAIPLIGEYRRINTYDDTDSSFIANLIKDYALGDTEYSNIISRINTSGYADITDCSKFNNVRLCEAIKNSSNIADNDRILIAEANLVKLQDDIKKERFLTEDGYRGLKEYIKYLNESFNPDTNKNKYIIIISRTAKNITFVLENDKVQYKEEFVTKYGKVGIDYE